MQSLDLSFNFSNQNIIVTGGTRGIGAAITKAFLQAGALHVTATYNKNHQAAENFLTSLGEDADRVNLIAFDISRPASIFQFFEEYERRHQALHVLVNNSGIRKDQMLPLMPIGDLEEVHKVNLHAPFYMCQRASQMMMSNRYGRIVNISSISAHKHLAGQAAYASSKAALEAMSSILAKEVGKKGITVNCLAPGFIETEMLEGLTPDLVKDYKREIPLRRFGRPEEVAFAVLFLASQQNNYMTGSTLTLSGGLS